MPMWRELANHIKAALRTCALYNVKSPSAAGEATGEEARVEVAPIPDHMGAMWTENGRRPG